MVFVVGLGAFVSTCIGGLFALRLKDRLHLILGFSAGAVVAVALFDLVPEAFRLIPADRPVPATALIAIGFGCYMVLDRMVALHYRPDDKPTIGPHTPTRGLWGAVALSLHSFVDGLGIGLAFQVSASVGWVVALAVLAHDFSDGINTVSIILKDRGDRRRALRWLLLDAVAPVVGVLAASLFQIKGEDLGRLLALFAGFFLYIGASDLLPESYHAHPRRWTTVASLLGMASIYAVTRLAG